MHTITKEFRFEAAHKLPHHDGKCARLHGHSWRGRVVLAGHKLIESGPKAGMLMDFGDVSKVLRPLVENNLDHQYLNESLPLENPTSEEIAKWLFHTLAQSFKGALVAVEIDETCTSSCRYELGYNEGGAR